MASTIYPAAEAKRDGKWGGQYFPSGYTPVALDSEAAARARMIVALDAGANRGIAIGAALRLPSGAGSDEAGTALRIYGELMEESATLAAVPLDAEATYTAAITAKAVHLDPAIWVARMKAKLEAEGKTLEPAGAAELPAKV